MLRDLDRRTRSAQNQKARPGPAGPPGKDGAEGRPGKAAPTAVAPVAAVVLTGRDGRATWVYETPLATAPVIGALVHDLAPDGATTLTVVLEAATPTQATVRVWRTRPLLGLGLLPAVPAGEGVAIHLTATPVPPRQLTS